MVEGNGDVAFVKHTTVFENTDGRNGADWAKSLVSPVSFSLLFFRSISFFFRRSIAGEVYD